MEEQPAHCCLDLWTTPQTKTLAIFKPNLYSSWYASLCQGGNWGWRYLAFSFFNKQLVEPPWQPTQFLGQKVEIKVRGDPQTTPMELGIQAFCTLKLGSEGWDKNEETRKQIMPLSPTAPLKETSGPKGKAGKAFVLRARLWVHRKIGVPTSCLPCRCSLPALIA